MKTLRSERTPTDIDDPQALLDAATKPWEAKGFGVDFVIDEAARTVLARLKERAKTATPAEKRKLVAEIEMYRAKLEEERKERQRGYRRKWARLHPPDANKKARDNKLRKQRLASLSPDQLEAHKAKARTRYHKRENLKNTFQVLVEIEKERIYRLKKSTEQIERSREKNRKREAKKALEPKYRAERNRRSRERRRQLRAQGLLPKLSEGQRQRRLELERRRRENRSEKEKNLRRKSLKVESLTREQLEHRRERQRQYRAKKAAAAKACQCKP